MTAAQFAAAVGVAGTVVDTWREAGLLVGGPDRYPLVDVERARLILYVGRQGIAVDEVAAACATQGDLIGHFADLITTQPRIGRPVSDVTGELGADADVVRRLLVAAGLGDQDELYDEDLQAFGWLQTVLAGGLPEDALLQLVRVYADAIGRVAEAEGRLFHFYVHEPLRAQGLEGDDLTAATAAVSDAMIDLVEPTILYFHRKAFQRTLRDDLVLHLREATTSPGQDLGEMQAIILFVDLSGFTPLTETMGDAAAARVVERFSEVVRAAASRYDGKVVKQIGDAFMLAFADPAKAIIFGVEVEEAVTAEPNFPAVRIGAHHGTVLYREGDYIGTTVNIAARVTATAQRHQLLVTGTVAAGAPDLDGIEVVPIGARPLKGISGEMELFHPRRPGPRPDRIRDRVCHMELDRAALGVTIDWEGTIVRFCSTDCAELFTAAPERYSAYLIED